MNKTLVCQNQEKIWQKYEIWFDKFLGEGSFGEVYLGCQRQSRKLVAIKIMDYQKQDPLLITREVSGMSKLTYLKHINIMGFINCYIVQSSAKAFLFLQYCSGGSLQKILDRPQNNNGLDEQLVMDIFSGIVRGMSYVNSKGIIHRDLALKNILMHENNIKIGDFGLCRGTDKQSNTDKQSVEICLTSDRGTLLYQCPQVSSSTYSFNCDVWSCGMILYQLLRGNFFENQITGLKKLQQFHQQMRNGDEIYLQIKKKIHPKWKGFLNEMICHNPNKRVNFQKIQKQFQVLEKKMRIQIRQNRNLPQQQKYSKLTKSAIQIKITEQLQFIQQKYSRLLTIPEITKNCTQQSTPKIVIHYMNFLNICRYITIFKSICNSILDKTFIIPFLQELKLQQSQQQLILLDHHYFHLQNLLLQQQLNLKSLCQIIRLFSEEEKKKLPKYHLYLEGEKKKYSNYNEYEEAYNICLQKYINQSQSIYVLLANLSKISGKIFASIFE